MPDLVAAMASTAEIVLPILLAFGLLTRWAALGLLGMTAIIQLTYPDGWANFHLYWAAMALAILTFGPGAISLDRLHRPRRLERQAQRLAQDMTVGASPSEPPTEQSERVRAARSMQECPAPPRSTGRN